MNERKKIVFAGMIVALSLGSMVVCAKSSINDLHDQSMEKVLMESPDGTNTAEVLSELGTFSSKAVVSQYYEKDASGKLVESDLSRMILASESVLTETGFNGTSVVDEIPTVSELIAYIDPQLESVKEPEYDLNKLDQLTYMQDLKYLSTGYRVITGAEKAVDGKEIRIDDGMLEVTLHGGEIIRSAQLEDYVILLVNPHTKDYTFLKMKEYDSETGIYTVVFPYNGPFMVLQNMSNM